MAAKALVVVCTASKVGLTSIIGDKTSLVDKFVCARGGTPLARSSHCACTVENELHAQVDIIRSRVSSDFDATARARE
jgi:hypothetical protein